MEPLDFSKLEQELTALEPYLRPFFHRSETLASAVKYIKALGFSPL